MVDTRTGRDIDRGYAWVILAACAVARYITVTLWIAYSILILEIKATFNTSHSLAGWGGSFQTGTSCLSGFLVGSLTQRFGVRPVCMVCCTVGSLGLFLTGYALNVYTIFVTYGIMTGVMHGSVTINTIVIMQRYFNKYRTLTTGLIYMADASATFTFTPVYSFLIRHYGWRNVTTIHACLTLQMVALSAMLFPLSPAKLELSALENHEKAGSPEPHAAHDTAAKHSDDVKSTKHSRFQNLSNAFGLTLFLNKKFLVFLFNHVLLTYSWTCMYIQNPSRALSNGVDKMRASMLPSTIGLFSTLARPFSSFIGNMTCTNKTFFVSILILSGGTVVCLSHFAQTFITAAICAGAFGFCFGGQSSLRPSLMVDWVGVQQVALAQGWVYTAEGLVTISVLPFTGWLYDTSGNFDAAFLIAGSMAILSGLTSLIFGIYEKCAKPHEEEVDEEKRIPSSNRKPLPYSDRPRLDSDISGSLILIPA